MGYGKNQVKWSIAESCYRLVTFSIVDSVGRVMVPCSLMTIAIRRTDDGEGTEMQEEVK